MTTFKQKLSSLDSQIETAIISKWRAETDLERLKNERRNLIDAHTDNREVR